MLRVGLLASLLVPPATAQDFYGLMPGMGVEALAVLGSPTRSYEQDDRVVTRFDLPWRQRLSVLSDAAGTIVSVSNSGGLYPTPPPDATRLFHWNMTVQEFVDVVGDEAQIDAPGLAMIGVVPLFTGSFEIQYDVPSHPGLLLSFSFIPEARPLGDLQVEPTQLPLPLGTRLSNVRLFDRSIQSHLPETAFIGGHRTAPIYFPIPLGDAFPSLIP